MPGTGLQPCLRQAVLQGIELVVGLVVDLHQTWIGRREAWNERGYRVRVLAVILTEDGARPLAEKLRDCGHHTIDR